MDTMRQLGLVSGDIIEILGRNRAAAVVWPAYPEDRGLGIIRIDGNIRGNAHVGIDDKVVISKAKSNPAVKITLAPTQPVRIVGGEDDPCDSSRGVQCRRARPFGSKCWAIR